MEATKQMIRRVFAISLLVLFGLALLQAPVTNAANSDVCKIPRNGDTDNNGWSDDGVIVVCNYTALYVEDANGDYYWDLGDGRIQSSAGISSVADLDQSTLTTCDYQIHTRGTFENDAFQDSGVISNMIHCYGYDGNSTYHYQIVHATDNRYTGDPAWAIWGDWEYHVLTESGSGNLIHSMAGMLLRPM
jgi:hypothetical protein